MCTEQLLRRVVLAVWLGALGVAPLGAQAPALAPRELGVKYMRDSEEYAALARQTYRVAGEAVARSAAAAGRQPWSVVLDIDETALDNSTYQLERAAYGLPFDAPSWAAWIARREAGAVPGVLDFVTLVRHNGGHVAWITNRDAAAADATRANLQALKLWDDDDRLCPQKTPQHTKAMRRAELVSGKGDCAWSGIVMRVVAFVGDQTGDFPDAAEHIPGTGTDDAFGRICFLLPNSMYGGWVTAVTRVRRPPPP
jgi:5'-nucleotidase (lipoprotein e(P4) family)